LVITVAPQKDILPYGKVYPRNAAAINRIRIVTPVLQTIVLIKDL